MRKVRPDVPQKWVFPHLLLDELDVVAGQPERVAHQGVNFIDERIEKSDALPGVVSIDMRDKACEGGLVRHRQVQHRTP